jgi:hypothetical protein
MFSDHPSIKLSDEAEIFVSPWELIALELPPWLRHASREARAHEGRCTVGHFIKSAGGHQLTALLQAAMRLQSGDSTSLCQIHLLALLLANGEGLPVRARDSVGELARRMLLYVQAELHRRAGRAKFDPMQLSLESFCVPGANFVVRGRR